MQVSYGIEHNVPIPMRDGTILRADVYRPMEGGRHPVLLARTPYGKSQAVGGFIFSALERGYSIVLQDVRGQGSSEGDSKPFIHEQEDGFDSIQWIAGQPWSDGTVGMFGWSYLGYTQWAAAAAQPPALKAIVPAMTFCDPYQSSYGGGALRLGLSVSWLLYIGALTQIQRMPLDLSEKQRWLLYWTKTVNGLVSGETWRCLPLEDMPLVGKNGIAPYFADQLAHPEADAYWEAIRIPYERINIPTLQIGGWYDVFLRCTLRDFQALVQQDGPARHQLVIGPWTHGSFDALAGDAHFGVQATGLATRLDELHLNWFDAWLKNDGNPVHAQPPVRLFNMGSSSWQAAVTWPPQDVALTRFYLSSQGKANTRRGDGRLALEPTDDEAVDIFQYHPENPVPTRGGSVWGWMGTLPGGAYDQRAIEDRPDVLVYTSGVLDHPLEISGSMRVELWASTTAVETAFTAKLIDVFPDGAARNLQDGIITTRAQHGDLLPGNPAEFSIDLAAIEYRFQAGHRIRIEISSSNFPQYVRNLNTGRPIGEDAQIEIATQTIYHDASHPSAVVLPMIQLSEE